MLNRVGQNGTISQSDFDDLSKAFGPYDKSFNPTMPDCPAPSPLGGHLVGPANEARLNELTQAVCERFCKLTPALAVNLRSQQFSKIQTTFAQANTSANRITATTGPSRVSTHRTRGSGRSETRVRTRRRSGPVGCDGRTG
ncbi:hypothetical protein [Methylobacterium sp. Leaf87]|uniref:hypothetical protein n=1 Tax=Methylobacterium sp. Leaf87 TaxID=1736243 RepID=UPI0012E930C6|nr:hypothetical protein [Methylobacterium sp. Leaf87]